MFAIQKFEPREAAKFTLLLPGQHPSRVGGEARISAGTSKGFRSLSKQPTKGLAATRRDGGFQDWKPPLNANRHPQGGAYSPRSLRSCRRSPLLFVALGGSGRSGLHVLNRCAGSRENIKVKTGGSGWNPGAPPLPVFAGNEEAFISISSVVYADICV